MQFIFKNKKVIALLLIVAQLIVNAGTQTFAVSFSKVMSKTLEGMEQPEDISTRYYEEFRYEARTYLFNDSDSSDGEKSEIDNFDGEKSNDDKQVDNENNDNINNDDKDEETTYSNNDEKEERDDSLDDIEGDYEDVPEELDDDGNVINPTTRPNRNNSDEEPKEDADGARETRPYDDEEKTDGEESQVSPMQDEEEDDDGARETRPYDDEEKTDGEESQVSPMQDEEDDDKEENIGENSGEKSKEEEIGEEVNSEEASSETKTIEIESIEESSEEASSETETIEVESIEESSEEVSSETENVEVESSETETIEVESVEESSQQSEQNPVEISTDVFNTATISETEEIQNESIEEVASQSEIKTLGGLLGTLPEPGDGTHVHKICGVVEGAPCLHTEAEAHSEVGDYRLIAVDEDEIMASIIDDIIGRVDDGSGNYENIEGPEYLVLGRDIEFDKSVEGNPRDASADYYTVDFVRDLYLCLNGHSIRNIIFKSSNNSKLVITNCKNTISVIDHYLTRTPLFSNCVQIFGIDQNIVVDTANIMEYTTANYSGTTFYGVKFTGENIPTGTENLFNFNVSNVSLIFEKCNFQDIGKDDGNKYIGNILYIRGNSTVTIKDCEIKDNAGFDSGIIYVIGTTTIKPTVNFKGTNIITENKVTDTTTGFSIRYGTCQINMDGHFELSNNEQSGSNILVYHNATTVFTLKEGATYKVINNTLHKSLADKNTHIYCLENSSDSKMTVYGDFEISGNRVINCGTSTTGSYMAVFSLIGTQTLNLGSGKITINNNNSFKDSGATPAEDSKYANHHLYQFYKSTANDTYMITMVSGYKFNTDSRIFGAAKPNGQKIKVMKWTSDTVDDINAYATCFAGDTYYFDDMSPRLFDGDNNLYIAHEESNHKHKLCGVSIENSCLHTVQSAHTTSNEYYKLNGSISAAEAGKILAGFSASDAAESFYLDADFESTSTVTISLLRDLNLCLNGHSLKNFRFYANSQTAAVKLNICNCSNERSTITCKETNGASFRPTTYIYGNDERNIVLNVARLYETYYKNINFVCYGVDMDGTGMTGNDSDEECYYFIKNIHDDNYYMSFENVEIHNYTNKFGVMFEARRKGGKTIIKDFYMHDNVFNHSKAWGVFNFNMNTEGKTANLQTATIKGDFEIYNNKLTGKIFDRLVEVWGTNLTFEDGANVSIRNNESTSDVMKCLISFGPKDSDDERTSTGYGQVTFGNNTKFDVLNNSITKMNTEKDQSIIGLHLQTTFKGEVNVIGNKVNACGTIAVGNYVAAVDNVNNVNIFVGSKKITIKDNLSYKDNGVTPANDVQYKNHHMYGFMSVNTDIIFKQLSGTKFNPESYVERIAFAGEATGNIAKWTTTEVNTEDLDKYNVVFVADNTYMLDYRVLLVNGMAAIKDSSGHEHKACGLAGNVACSHTEISNHTETYEYSRAAVNNVSAFIKLLTGSDKVGTSPLYLFLNDDIDSGAAAGSATLVTPVRDLYICLNGHKMSGFRFTGSKTIYITNCKDEVSTITCNTTELFSTINIHVFGLVNASGEKNIIFKSSRVVDVKGGNSFTELYNVLIDGSGVQMSSSYAVIYTEGANRKLNIENVDIKNIGYIGGFIRFNGQNTSVVKVKNLKANNIKVWDYVVFVDGSDKVYFKGKNEFNNVTIGTATSDYKYNCYYFSSASTFEIQKVNEGDGIYINNNRSLNTTDRRYLVGIEDNFTVKEGATFSVKNSSMRKNRNTTGNGSIVVCFFSTGAQNYSILGNLEVTGNKIVQCQTYDTDFLAAVYMGSNGKTITLGNGKITIKDNKAYYDDAATTEVNDETYITQHMFNLLTPTRTESLFTVASGKKLNMDSEIDGLAFYSIGGYGKVVNWSSTVADDVSKYSSIFKPDRFFNPWIESEVASNGYVVLNYGAGVRDSHKHKLCGVADGAACTHTETAAHTSSISYKPISEHASKNPTVFGNLLAGKGSGNEPSYYYLDSDISRSSITQLTFTNDIYLCLNGHNISGYALTGSANYYIGVTNCSTTTSTFRFNNANDYTPLSGSPLRVYGINKNLILNAPRLCNINGTQHSEFYEIIFDGTNTPSADGKSQLYLYGDGVRASLENVIFRNHTKMQRAINIADDKKNITLTFKNLEMYNENNCYYGLLYLGNQTSNKITFKGENKIHDCNLSPMSAGLETIRFCKATVTINSGASLKIYNNKVGKYGSTYTRGMLANFQGGTLNINEGGSFEIVNNTVAKLINNANDYNTEIISFTADSKFNCLGNFIVTDNKVSSCGTNKLGTFICAVGWHGTGNNSIVVGNGKITINNNKAYKDDNCTTLVDDRNYPNHHMYQLYSFNTSLVFSQKSGTKFNTDSRINLTLAGVSEGKVANWTANEYNTLDSYKSIFSTDYFGDDDPMLVVYKNNAVNLISSANYHVHKICGVATNSTCTHTLITTRHDNVEFTRLGSTLSADQFVSTIKGVSGQAAAYYYLRGDVTTTSEKEVALQRDVYLCLNGYSISGFRFTGNGRKIYICNCRDDKVSTIKNILSTNLLFATNVQIYGSTNNNIKVNSGRVIDVTTTIGNSSVSFYNVNFDGTGAKAIIWTSGKTTNECTSLYFNAYTTNFENCILQNFTNNKKFLFETINATVNLKNVTFTKNKKFKWGMFKLGNTSYGGTINVDGYVDILSNESKDSNNDYFFNSYGNINVKDNAGLLMKGNIMSKNKVMIVLYKNANITTGENSYFGIVENTMDKFTGDETTGFIMLDAAAKDLTIKGDFEIRGNKINNCGTSTTGNYLYGIYLPANRYINIGSGKITIQNNRSYSNNGTTLANDTKYKMQHLYQLYADYSSHKSNGIFKVISGKKLNSESKIEGIALTAYNYNGNIVKWDNNIVDDADINKYNEIFKADPFNDDELDIGYNTTSNWVVLEFGAPKHKHKVCGVASAAVCVHTAAASHGDNIVGYRKLTKELDRSTITTSLTNGGAFVLLDDIDPAKFGDGGAKDLAVTVSNDLYICLNGHSLSGITFTGGAAKTIYITNCSTSKGTYENTVNSTAAFTNISTEIYGINKNIDVLQNKFAYLNGAASNNQRIRLYSLNFKQGTSGNIADSYIYITQGSTNASSIEDCDFDGLRNYSLFRSEGERTVIIKNNTFKNMTFKNYFMSFDKGTTKMSFVGNNIIDNVKYANTASDYFIHFGSYAGNDIKIDGNTSITNCESYYNANHFFHVGAGHVTITDNSKLTINKNRLYNTAIYGRAMLYLGSNADFNLSGNLEIKNNAFVGTRQSHSDVGLWYANSTKPIIVGSTSIVISDNTTTNYKANVRNLYSYYAGAEGVFSQKAGTKLNAYDTMIGSIALNTEDYTGVVYNSWDGNHIVGYGDVNFAEIFKADTYGGRKGIITARDGEEIVITFGDHFHKVCGTLATMSCTHNGIDDHGVGTTPDIMHTYLALRWNDMDDLKNKLRLGGEYFLIRKIKFDTPTVIDLESDLYLCLTSYFVENVIFTSSTGKKAYITTCIEQFEEQQDEEEEEIEEEEGTVPSPTSNMGSKRNERYEVALVATASGMGAMFKSAVELYSPYNLLNVYANKLYESSGSSEPVILSGVNLHNDPKTANAGNYIEITGDEEIVLEGVSISTMSNVGCVVKTENSTLTLCGEINIYRNEDLRSLFDVKSINQKNGSVKVYDNLIKRVGGKQNIIKVSTASYLYGALEVTNNKIINADAGNNSGVFAIFNVASPGYIHIENTKIYMEENNAYSDSGNTLTDLDAYPCHYVYSIYSNNFDGMFVQDKGTSMDASSRVNVSFDGPKYRGTVVKSWSSGDVYDTVFTADHNIDGDTGFNRIRMNVALEGSDVIIDDRIRIYFKEGISEYKKIGNSPISIYQIVSWGDPYELGTMFKWGGRELVGYRDERGVYYRLGKYPKGLVLNRGSITLTALWHHRSSDANIIDPGQKYDDVLIKRDAVIIGGRWVYDRMNKKWMYYLNSNVSENVVDSLFPNGDSGIFVGMSSTDMRRYLRNGIYQIYYNGESYFFRFDENGYMITGLSEANGSYYYFTESGVLEGAMQLDPIVMGDKKIIFDVYGRIVREMDPSSGDVQIIRATYQKMEGMDDYYEPIPSLVGWN